MAKFFFFNQLGLELAFSYIDHRNIITFRNVWNVEHFSRRNCYKSRLYQVRSEDANRFNDSFSCLKHFFRTIQTKQITSKHARKTYSREDLANTATLHCTKQRISKFGIIQAIERNATSRISWLWFLKKKKRFFRGMLIECDIMVECTFLLATSLVSKIQLQIMLCICFNAFTFEIIFISLLFLYPKIW